MPLPEWLKEDHRTTCVGRNIKIILFQPLPWVGTPSTKPSRSKPHLAWPGVIIMNDIIQLIAAWRKGHPAGWCPSDAGCAARWGAARTAHDPGQCSEVPGASSAEELKHGTRCLLLLTWHHLPASFLQGVPTNKQNDSSSSLGWKPPSSTLLEN